MDNYELPLKVGQLAESRSFLSGYRGAWFRCKINDFRQRRKEMECSLEYTDFPDEKIEWTKMYEKPSAGRRSRTMKSQLMIRPSFPPVYRESQMPDVNSISEVVVIVNDVWKVGDLVDWWSDSCYWSARITESLEEGKFRIEFPLPPVGEGSTYEAFCTDLRPSLDWSPTDGWTLPTPERECCARLVKPVEQGSSQNLTIQAVDAVDEVREDAQDTDGASLENNASFSSHISASSLPPLDRSEQHRTRPLSPAACTDTQTPETNMGFDAVNAGIVKSSCSDSVSSSHVRNAAAAGTAAAKEGYQNTVSLNKIRIDGSIPLNSLRSDTIEASILDLEELVNRVKWIKDILKLGTPSSNTLRPSCNFEEYRPSSINDCFGKKD